MLFNGYRRRFAGGANNYDGVRTFCNMPVNQFFQTWQIKTSVLMHRRDDSNDAALDHNCVTAKI